MDQELGLKWLEQDFELNTRPKVPQAYCLLILDGHNSYCTYPFIKFATEHHIIIICLLSHTTHALQPCDVSIFGPLACAWKSQVTQASQANIPIIKANLLLYYHKAQSIALKPSTIQSAFQKTGICPFDRNMIPLSAFKPGKNTTTLAAQPLQTQLPLLLIPMLTPSPITSARGTLTLNNNTPAIFTAPLSSIDLNINVSVDPDNTDSIVGQGTNTLTSPEPRQYYHIQVPPGRKCGLPTLKE